MLTPQEIDDLKAAREKANRETLTLQIAKGRTIDHRLRELSLVRRLMENSMNGQNGELRGYLEAMLSDDLSTVAVAVTMFLTDVLIEQASRE